MALSKQKFREIVLQILFSYNFLDSVENDLIAFMMQKIKTTKKNVIKANNYALKIKEKIEKIDEDIGFCSTGYSLSRICLVEISVLRLALFEMLYDDMDIKIAIAEANRLAKKFSGKQSVSFVNAILDKIYQNKRSSNLTSKT
jgi:transcription antitermination protein NusB